MSYSQKFFKRRRAKKPVLSHDRTGNVSRRRSPRRLDLEAFAIVLGILLLVLRAKHGHLDRVVPATVAKDIVPENALFHIASLLVRLDRADIFARDAERDAMQIEPIEAVVQQHLRDFGAEALPALCGAEKDPKVRLLRRQVDIVEASEAEQVFVVPDCEHDVARTAHLRFEHFNAPLFGQWSLTIEHVIRRQRIIHELRRILVMLALERPE